MNSNERPLLRTTKDIEVAELKDRTKKMRLKY